MFGANFLGKMFGTEKALERGVDAIASGFDKLIYTSEEKAEDEAKKAQAVRDFISNWMKNSTGQSVTRKFLAVSTSSVWLLQFISMNLLSVYSLYADKTQRIDEVLGIMTEYSGTMKGAVMLVLGFYFAPHIPGIAIEAIKKFKDGK